MFKLEPKIHNSRLLTELYDKTVETMRSAQGTRYGVNQSTYIDEQDIRDTVEYALEKVRQLALDEWRQA